MHFEWAQNAGNGFSEFKYPGVRGERVPTELPGFSQSASSQLKVKFQEKRWKREWSRILTLTFDLLSFLVKSKIKSIKDIVNYKIYDTYYGKLNAQ